MENVKFSDLGLNERVLRAIDDMGFEEPSHIQAEVIPVLLQGYDAIGQAQTGTGKTLAFGAPILSKFERIDGKIHTIILAPTRELAIQVNDELVRIAKYTKVRTLPVYGGQPIERQIKALKGGIDIIVGTPGRVMDLMRRNIIDLSDIKFLVLDEADEMLDMGFIDDIEEIVKTANKDRQTMLFSATMPDEIKKLSKRYMKEDRKHISIVKNTMTVSTVSQYYYEVKQNSRFESFCRILDVEEPSSAIIFCKTKKGVDELVEAMQSRGYSVEGMHGDMNQNQRLNTLRKFKEGNLEFLVATDVAARGIDVENVTHVINYDLPQDIESYVHRIGRTGRANREGVAYSLVTPREYMTLKQIEKVTKSKIKRKDIPTIDDIFLAKYKNIFGRVKETLEQEEYKRFVPLAAELDDEYNLVDVAAALMNILYNKEVSFDYTENDIAAESNFVRLFLTVGRMDRLNPKTLLQFFNEYARANREDIGDIDLLEKFTFVDVSERVVDSIIKNCSGRKLCGRKVKIEVSKPRK
ncbi:DEAD/DEAH box helicase [Clostridium sp. SYSU_GA19001]|uniref:DEAD/DEAH box helicase n=1 Tax=Clostridium caldaquaticum TaxID=2940653 RepID=UPI0020778DF5|nr:DEAD/DEAH box helicase [Clostridium caldaquaticum]MCM8710217.1 DEAD/DEAH box helicase [Clostridium caldaquaticum]